MYWIIGILFWAFCCLCWMSLFIVGGREDYSDFNLDELDYDRSTAAPTNNDPA